jgi:Na+/proline symporter
MNKSAALVGMIMGTLSVISLFIFFPNGPTNQLEVAIVLFAGMSIGLCLGSITP